MSLAMNTSEKNYNPIKMYDVETYSVVLIHFKSV